MLNLFQHPGPGTAGRLRVRTRWSLSERIRHSELDSESRSFQRSAFLSKREVAFLDERRTIKREPVCLDLPRPETRFAGLFYLQLTTHNFQLVFRLPFQPLTSTLGLSKPRS